MDSFPKWDSFQSKPEWSLDLYAHANKGSLKFFQDPAELEAIEKYITSLPSTPYAPADAKPVDPAQLIKKAGEEESLAQKSPHSVVRMAHLETALFNYQVAGELEGAKRVLQSMKKEFARKNNIIGVAKVDAEMAFLEGRLEEALKEFSAIESILLKPDLKWSKDERDLALTEMNLKISLTHRARAAQLAKDNFWQESLNHMEAALLRSPTPVLAGETLAVLNQHWQPKVLRKQISDLKGEIERLRFDPTPCNSNCHTANKPDYPSFSSTQFDQTALDPTGSAFWNPTPQDPKYQHLVHPSKKNSSLLLNRRVPSKINTNLSSEELDQIEAFLKGEPVKEIKDPKPKTVTPQWDDPALKIIRDFQNQPYTEKNFYGNYYDASAQRENLRHQKEEELKILQGKYEDWIKKSAWVVRTGYGNAKNGDEFFAQEMALAEVYRSAGDLDQTLLQLENTLKAIPANTLDAGVTFQRAAVTHQLALVQFQEGSGGKKQHPQPYLLDRAIENLDRSYQELSKIPFQNGRDFLINQNRFIKAEILLAQAKNEKDVNKAKGLLEDLLRARNPRHLSLSDPNRALLGRVQLRLAQLYFGLPKEKNRGHELVAEIQRTFPEDKYLNSQALLAQGMGYLQTEGKSLKGLEVLRELQINYPGTEADKTVRSAKNLENLRNSDGILKKDIDESDFGEAFKVALDKAVNTGTRKIGFIAAGFALVLILVPEPSTTAFGLGMLGGLVCDMTLGVAENTDKILDAYHSGISTVDSTKTLQNIFLLTLDVAMLVTAGAGGALVRTGTEAGLSRLALSTSQFLARSEMGVLTARALMPIGEGLHFILPRVAESAAAYTLYKGQHALFLGQDFKWDPVEALMMFGMMQSFSMTRYMGTGARVTQYGKFQKGNLYPVHHEGKLIGFTNRAGQMAGWATDTVVGATGFYGMMLGMNASSPIPGGLPDFGDYLAHNIYTLGALHLGGKLVPHSFNRSLMKLDAQSKKWLEQARKNIDDSGFGDSFPGFGPQLATIGGYGTNLPSRSSTFETTDFLGKPRPMSMTAIGQGRKGSGALGKTQPEVDAKLAKQRSEIRQQLHRYNYIKDRFLDAKIDVDALTPAQVQVLHAVIKIRSNTSDNLLAEILMENHDIEILKIFPRLSNAEAKVLLEMLQENPGPDHKSLPRRFFQNNWLFEEIPGTKPGQVTSRANLVLEAYSRLRDVPGIEGALEVAPKEYIIDNGTFSKYPDAKRSNWRGHVDELIILGQIHSEAIKSGDRSSQLRKINSDLDEITYRDVKGFRVDKEGEADGITRDNGLEEIKTTYDPRTKSGRVYTFEGKDSAKIKNQAIKYAKAQKRGLVGRVTYRFTARSVESDVLEFLKATIPNLRIIRYKSITDPKPVVVFEQNLTGTLTPNNFFDLHPDKVVMVTDGKLQAYSLTTPRQMDAPWATEAVSNLKEAHAYILGTEWTSPSTSSRESKFKYQTEKLGEILKHAEKGEGEKIVTKTMEIFDTAADLPGPQGLDHLARQLDILIHDLIIIQGLGSSAAAMDLPAKKYSKQALSIHGEADGTYQFYMSSKEAKAFRKSLPTGDFVNRSLTLKAGTILFPQRGYTPSEVNQLKESKQGGEHLLSFDSSTLMEASQSRNGIKGNSKSNIERIILPDGQTAWKLLKDVTLNTGTGMKIKYYGENPHLDIYQSGN